MCFFTNLHKCSYALHLETSQRKASRAFAPCARIRNKRKTNNFVDCGWIQAWAPRNMLLRGSSQGGFWGRGALKRWDAWTLGLGSCGVGWRLENIFLELAPRLDWHLHMLTQGRQGRSWDKSASRGGRSLSLVDQLMTAFLPEKECSQVTWVKSQFWLFVNCSLEVDKAIFICK